MKLVQFKTARLVLRSVEDADVDKIFALRSNEEVVRFIGATMSRDEVRELMTERRESWTGDERQELSLLVEHKQGGEFVGEVVLRYISATARQAEIGCALMPQHQGRGVGAEATIGVLRYAFEDLGLHRVFALSDVGNKPAKAVLIKLGMQAEGVLRHNVRRNGAWHDDHLLAMLEDEWAALRSSFSRYLE